VPLLRTLAAPERHEIPKIRGSRFLATAERVGSGAAAMAFVERMRGEFADATHNCFAWWLSRDEQRASDDGEPSGTAGRPILQEITGRGLSEVAVVVTRYYGGTKLGTGGLVRAYGEAAAAVLDRARIVEVPVVRELVLSYDYALTGVLTGVHAAFGAVPGATDYGAAVRQQVAVPVEREADYRQALVDAAAGRIDIEPPAGGAQKEPSP
jgi:uncharacterized YigZ family protein